MQQGATGQDAARRPEEPRHEAEEWATRELARLLMKLYLGRHGRSEPAQPAGELTALSEEASRESTASAEPCQEGVPE